MYIYIYELYNIYLYIYIDRYRDLHVFCVRDAMYVYIYIYHIYMCICIYLFYNIHLFIAGVRTTPWVCRLLNCFCGQPALAPLRLYNFFVGQDDPCDFQAKKKEKHFLRGPGRPYAIIQFFWGPGRPLRLYNFLGGQDDPCDYTIFFGGQDDPCNFQAPQRTQRRRTLGGFSSLPGSAPPT